METHDLQQVVGTGLSGMVGSRFTALYGAAYQFANLDLTTGVDITDEKQVDTAIGSSPATVIIHLAAFTNVSGAHEQNGDKSGSCYAVNVTGTENIAKAAAHHGKYLIHVSTDFIFDGSSDTPYVETDTPHPIEWYGQTKFWAEEEVEKAGGRHVILRLAYPYQRNPMRPDFLAKVIENLKNNTLPPAFTNHTITPTFVDDFAAVLDYCIQHQPTGVYHAVGSSSHTDFEIATMVKEIFGLQGEIKPGDVDEYIRTVARPYQKTMRVSNEKLKHDFVLGMKTLKEGLEAIASGSSTDATS